MTWRHVSSRRTTAPRTPLPSSMNPCTSFIDVPVESLWRAARKKSRATLFDLGEPLGQLDVRAPRIFDEGDVDAERIDLAIGDRQRNACVLEPLRECFEVLDLEADVIERSALRGDRRRRRGREAQRDSGQLVRDERL